MRSDLELFAFDDPPFDGRMKVLPGVRLFEVVSWFDITTRDQLFVEQQLLHACRKLGSMWFGADEAIRAEQDFYSRTITEAPELLGRDAVQVLYHLEAFVLLARSALDVASRAFGMLLPKPLSGDLDSFNDLVKASVSADASHIVDQATLVRWTTEETSWLRVLCGSEKGRSLRDKVAHQTKFPLDYAELQPRCARESAIVRLSRSHEEPLESFVDRVRLGTIDGFLLYEEACLRVINPM